MGISPRPRRRPPRRRCNHREEASMRALPILIILLALAGCSHRAAEHVTAEQASPVADQSAAQQRWRKAMDDGYAAMESGERERALALFEQALSAAPECGDADLCRAI